MASQMEITRNFDGTIERAELEFGGNKTAALTPYKGYVYIRISSLTSARSITLGTDELQELCSLKEEIPVEKAEKEIAKQVSGFEISR